jgi:hypothetical protein
LLSPAGGAKQWWDLKKLGDRSREVKETRFTKNFENRDFLWIYDWVGGFHSHLLMAG